VRLPKLKKLPAVKGEESGTTLFNALIYFPSDQTAGASDAPIRGGGNAGFKAREIQMSILQPWNLIFAIGFMIYMVTRGRFASRTKFNEKIERRVDTREKILLAAVFVTALLFPVLYLLTPLLSFANYQLPQWVHGCGLVIMIAALWLFWRSHADLGLNWSATLEMRKDHEIIQHGVYQWIRHPMYAAIWLFSIAQALLLDNWLAGWGVVGAFGLMYFLRVGREEQMLLDHFGKDYESYMARTGRLLPRLFRRN
jgi:protein-S-isoprenylcysteine O-methyltransferase Ste14